MKHPTPHRWRWRIPLLLAQLVILPFTASAQMFDNLHSSVTTSSGWTAATHSTDYLDNFIHDGNANKGSVSARFRPTISNAGYYEVAVRWVAGSNRAANVPVTITHSYGSDVVKVNQKLNGGTWMPLGVYRFPNGDYGNVLVSNSGTDGVVTVDAFRITPVATPELILDNPQASLNGEWPPSTNSGTFFQTNYLHDGGGAKSPVRSATYTPNITEAGLYDVSVWWPAWDNRATNTPVRLVTASGPVDFLLDQTIPGNKWESLGSHLFLPGTGNKLVISNEGTTPGKYVIADGVKFTKRHPMEIIVDDTDSAHVTKVGDWTVRAVEGLYGVGYLHDQNDEKGAKSVTFAPDLPDAGTYEVFTRWTNDDSFAHAINVPVTIDWAGGVTQKIVNQRVTMNQWVSLGTYNFRKGNTGTVTISNDGTVNHVVADAVRFVYTPKFWEPADLGDQLWQHWQASDLTNGTISTWPVTSGTLTATDEGSSMTGQLRVSVTGVFKDEDDKIHVTEVTIRSVINDGAAQSVTQTTSMLTDFNSFSFLGRPGTNNPTITFTKLSVSGPSGSRYSLHGTALDQAPGENTYIVRNNNTNAGLNYRDGDAPALRWTLGNNDSFTALVGKFPTTSLVKLGDTVTLSYAFTVSSASTFHASAAGAFGVGLFNAGGTHVSGNIASTGATVLQDDSGYVAVHSRTAIQNGNVFSRRNPGNTNLWTGSSLTNLQSTHSLQPVGASTVVHRPTKTSDASGRHEVVLAADSDTRLLFPEQHAHYDHHGVAIVFRIDLASANGAGVIFAANGVSTGTGRQPAITYNQTHVGVSWLMSSTQKNEIKFALSDNPTGWHCLVSRRVGKYHYASLDGKKADGTPGETVMEMDSWALPQSQNSPSGYIGDSRSDNPEIGIDTIIITHGPMSAADAEKLMAWGMWRRGIQNALPTTNRYRTTLPYTASTDYQFTEQTDAEWDAYLAAEWTAVSGNETGIRQGIGTNIDLTGWELVFQDNFTTHSVTNDVHGKGLWFAPVHPQPAGVAPSVTPPVGSDPTVGTTGSPETYLHSTVGNPETMTLRLQRDNNGTGPWKSGGFATVNSNGVGRTWLFPYVEARIKIVTQPGQPAFGAWPGVWLKSANYFHNRAETNLEYDIYEGYLSDNDDYYHHSLHNWPAARTRPGRLQDHRGKSHLATLGEPFELDKDVNDLFDGQYHTYAVMIRPDHTFVFFDGQIVGQHATQPEMKQPLWALLTLHMQGPLAGDTGVASGKYDMVIDYVKVMQNPEHPGFTGYPTPINTPVLMP